jgi:hypothetical protein
MPFKGNRIFVIVGILLFIGLIILAVASSNSGSSSSTQQQRGDPKFSVEIRSESVGLEYIVVTNENTGATAHILPQYLPMTINFAENDILTFTVYAKQNYIFNFWSLSDGTIESDNPLAIKPAKSFKMNALFMPDDIILD